MVGKVIKIGLIVGAIAVGIHVFSAHQAIYDAKWNGPGEIREAIRRVVPPKKDAFGGSNAEAIDEAFITSLGSKNFGGEIVDWELIIEEGEGTGTVWVAHQVSLFGMAPKEKITQISATATVGQRAYR